MAILRHRSMVFSAAFSPDGTRVVTAGGSGAAHIWDVASGNEIVALRGHKDTVFIAAFSPDGTRIVTGSDDETARVWDAENGQPLAVLGENLGIVMSASFSPDGTQIVTASWQPARLWDAATAKEIVVLRGHDDYVNSVSFSHDGNRIATASNDKTVRMSGTPKLVVRSLCCAATRTSHRSPPSVLTARALSPHQRTTPCGSGMFISRLCPPENLIAEVCTRRLRGLTTMSRDEMRLVGYPDDIPAIDVCAGISQAVSP